jgi:hypothetical protein
VSESQKKFLDCQKEALTSALKCVSNNRRLSKINVGLALEGSQYQASRSLMVVGRALKIDDGIDLRADGVDKICEQAISAQESRELLHHASQHWSHPHPASKYRYNSSAFWRVTRRILAALQPETDGVAQWPQHLVFSNLYKISASNRNPTEAMQRAQREACGALLALEVDYFQPRRLLLISGHQWWAEHFLRKEVIPYTPADGLKGDVIESAGWINQGETPVVVTSRPEGRGEDNFVGRVIQTFTALSRT